MPFGPTNGPATFVNFIHNVDSQWKALAWSLGIDIGDDTNTRVIIEDIISHGRYLLISLLVMECQLWVCLAYHLLLSLKKSFIFPIRFEFIGNDICPEGNRPAQSKHQLLKSCPRPKIVRDVAKFIGFAQYYLKYIHHFELQVAPLQALTTTHEYTNQVSPIWTDACGRSFDDIREAILSNPCLAHFNHRHLVILCTDFPSQGFGYVVCQPGTDEASKAAMLAYRSGSDFSFMKKDSSAVVRPVVFGGRRCRGNEIRSHSHLGNFFAED